MKLKSKITIAIVALMLVMITAVPAIAQSEVTVLGFPQAVNDTTLGIIVFGGISGALISNELGFIRAKSKSATVKYDPRKLAKTLIFAVLTGTMSAIGLASLLQIDIGSSVVQGFVLYIIATSVTMSIELSRQST